MRPADDRQLLPEQLRALGYARKRGTDSPLAEIRSRVAGTYAEIEQLVEAVDPAVAIQRSEASAWSVQEVVQHLVLSDRPAVQQLRSLLAGSSVEAHIPAGLQAARPFETPWPALLEQLRAVHRDILTVLDSASDAIPLVATAPVEMVVKCAVPVAPAAPEAAPRPVHSLERFDWKAYSILLHAHNREHIAQVRRILEAMGRPGSGAGNPTPR